MPDKKEAFLNLGKRLGLSDDMVNLLIQGRKATQDYLDEAAKAYTITKRDADNAAEAQKQWANLASAWQRVGNTILVQLAPSLIKLADGLEKIALWFQAHPDAAMAAFGTAMFFAASGAFRLAVSGLAAIGHVANIASIGRIDRARRHRRGGLGIGGAAAAVAGGAALNMIPGVARGSLAGAGAGRSIDAQLAAMQKQLADPDAPRAYVLRRIAELQAKRAVLGGGADFATPLPGAAAAAGVAVAGGSQHDQIVAFFMAHGASRAGAEGIAAGVSAEGGGPTSRDQYDAKGNFAFGIEQVRGSRQRALFRQFGPNPTLTQQLQFMLQELRQMTGGGAILGATDATAAMRAFITQFERPGSGTAGDLAARRARDHDRADQRLPTAGSGRAPDRPRRLCGNRRPGQSGPHLMALFPQVPDLPGVPALARSAINAVANFAAPALLTADGIATLGGSTSDQPQWGLFDSGGALVVAPDSVVDFEFRREQRIAIFPIEQGSFGSYNKVTQPYEGRLKMNKAGTESDRTDFLNAIDAALFSLDLYTLVMPEQTYDNANVEHYDFRRTNENGVQLLTVELWVQEVRIAGAPTFSNTKAPSGQDAQADGAVQAQTPTSGQSNLATAALDSNGPLGGVGGPPGDD